jgi:hypothetical protein
MTSELPGLLPPVVMLAEAADRERIHPVGPYRDS